MTKGRNVLANNTMRQRNNHARGRVVDSQPGCGCIGAFCCALLGTSFFHRIGLPVPPPQHQRSAELYSALETAVMKCAADPALRIAGTPSADCLDEVSRSLPKIPAPHRCLLRRAHRSPVPRSKEAFRRCLAGVIEYSLGSLEAPVWRSQSPGCIVKMHREQKCGRHRRKSPAAGNPPGPGPFSA